MEQSYPINQDYRFLPGQALLIALLFLVLASIAMIVSFSSIALGELRAGRVDLRAKQSYFLAEAGVEDVIWRIQTNRNYSENETVSIDGLTVAVSVVTNGIERTVEGNGSVANAVRKTRTVITVGGVGTSFVYGIQVSDGGLSMGNNSRVNGSVYSNGNIIGTNGSTISGDAIVAGGLPETPSVEWTTHDMDQPFATVSGNRDIAQSFTANASERISKVSVFLGKVGSPLSNITLRITADNSGKPATSALASGTIAPASVGTTPSWIDISFTSPPNLTTGTKYWIVLDYGFNSASDYWVWRKDSSDGYSGNTGRYTSSWSSGSAVWTDVGGDLAFHVWLGGTATRIEGLTIGDATSGSGRANVFVDTTVHGSSCPNPYCIAENPSREELPISDGVIADWKAAAAAGGTCAPPLCDASGNFSITNGATASIGPKKIPGNLSVDNNAQLTLTGTVHVVGNITLSNGCLVRLDQAFGNLSGVLVADGTVNVSNNCTFQGSGNPLSYIMLMTDKNTPTQDVMTISNNALGVIYYASRGWIHFSNNASTKEATGYGITMDNNSVITYESGLANLLFSSGPTGGWSIQSWNEVK